jgi:hypothetical protein
MPRIRSLKYEYFINEELAQASCEARLLGLGLTTLADREGRLEDRPLRIKASLFPYHDVDVNQAIDELQTAGFLSRYTVGDKRYIRIVNFLKHQKPHPREADSVIPSHEKVSPRQTKARLGKTKEIPIPEKAEPSRVVNGLGDLGSSVNGSGSGNGSGDSVGTGASAEQPKPGAQEVSIWRMGAGALMAVGMDEQDARGFLGAQCKAFGKEQVAAAIPKLLAQNPADPKTYLVKLLQNAQKPPNHRSAKVDGSMDAVRQVIAEKEALRDARN